MNHWKRPWCWERLRAGGEEGDRGWDGWMASPTQWTWVWASSGRQWRTGKPGLMQFMRSQRIRHNLVAEQQHVQLFCDPMDCVALPGSSVHGTSQARILKWVTIYFPRGIVPIQGSNLSLLYWPPNSLPPGKPLSKLTRSFYNPTSSIARLQLNMNCELPDIQTGFWKGRGTRDQIANIRLIIKKARKFQKNIYFCFIDYTKAFDCVDHHKYMAFRKMVTMTLSARHKKRHRCKEQTFGLGGRKRGWDDLRELHWNMFITICEIDRQFRFDAWDRVLRACALGWPWGMGWGGRWERVQDRGHVYTHGWFMSMYGKKHYSIVK